MNTDIGNNNVHWDDCLRNLSMMVWMVDSTMPDTVKKPPRIAQMETMNWRIPSLVCQNFTVTGEMSYLGCGYYD
jgi:hypothetical protein